MLSIILPETDAGAFVQLAVVLAIGPPALLYTIKRGWREVAWFVGGLLIFLLGFFALRAGH